ncbi:MAG: hypothetical protein WC455_12210 [Dehalococcoidia bacterium]|jgi:hypothetical protein
MSSNVRSEFLLGIAQAATWGTAIADGSSFTDLQEAKDPIIIPDVKIIDPDVARNTRTRDEVDVLALEKGSMPTCTIDLPRARCRTIPLLAYSYFQSVTEGASSPYKKTFIVHSTEPAFTSNAGCFSTICLKAPIASLSHKATDFVCKQLEFACSAGNYMSVKADMVGRGTVSTTANPSGTWTASTASFYYYEDMARFSYNFAGSISPNASNWKVTLKQDVIPMGQASGQVKTFALANKGGTIEGTLFYDASTTLIPGYFKAGTHFSFNVGWGNATAGTDANDFDITAYAYVKDSKISFGSELVTVDFSAELVAKSSTSTQMCTLIVADDADKGW